MTAEAVAVLERAKVLGVSLTLAVDAYGDTCVLWRAPRGTASPDLLADLRQHRAELLAHLKDGRKVEVLDGFKSAYQRLSLAYSNEDVGGLPEVERQFPDLHACVVLAEQEAEQAALAYLNGRGTLQGYLSFLATWERAVLDALAALDNARSGRLCTDCGAEAPVTLLTGLGQRICSKCARTDAVREPRAVVQNTGWHSARAVNGEERP